jgi:uncharacterized membrane protein YhaH (DUF805 family)
MGRVRVLLPILPILVAGIGMPVRRLHDRGKSGWWAAALVIFPELVSLERTPETSGAAPPALLALVSLIAAVLEIWGWVEIGFRRGACGANR